MLKKGKEEIIYLLNNCIEKFQLETGKEITQNTNRKNYEELAIVLSKISNQLPYTHESLGHQPYEAELVNPDTTYPFHKYDITGGQIKDALMGLVSNPRSFLIDTCYIYVYGKGRLAFETNPTDSFLIQKKEERGLQKDSLSLLQENQKLKAQLAELNNNTNTQKVEKNIFAKHGVKFVLAISFLLLLFCSYWIYTKYLDSEKKWQEVKADFNLVPYNITEEERAKLEGIWICYTGSPQARTSDSNRYHKVVANLIEITYKNGYFIYNRFGASFNHIGHIQFEAPGLLSIHSRIKNSNGEVESPRHSLMSLDSTGAYLSAISASWNFDVGKRNRIIGIREVYKKLGSGGKIEEVINSVENASCQCKIIRWRKPSSAVETFFLKNISLDALQDSSLLELINEKSILTKDPLEQLVLEQKSKKN